MWDGTFGATTLDLPPEKYAKLGIYRRGKNGRISKQVTDCGPWLE